MIEKHISALLYRYQCVTVPGFGAFLTETQPAQLNNDTHTFYPPKKLISFNANLKNNDGLLANHIALQEKISYEQAVANIGRETEMWFLRLQNRETLTLKNLGEIAYNFEGSLVFTPNTPINYLTDAFGLSSIVAPSVKREQLKLEAEALEEKAPIIFTPERKKNYSYLKYAAIFVVMAGIGTGGFKVYNDKYVAEQTLIVEKNVQDKLNNRIQQATFLISNPMPAVTLPVKEDNTTYAYHVVAAAFHSEANADKAVRQLTAKGYKARKLEKNRFGLYPVAYKSFATRVEAQQAMRDIHKTENREAWVYTK